jgi:hypothetical protein
MFYQFTPEHLRGLKWNYEKPVYSVGAKFRAACATLAGLGLAGITGWGLCHPGHVARYGSACLATLFH